MIDRTTTMMGSDFPLFHSPSSNTQSSSSSCGMEAIVIQRPLVESYSWSDFPIAVQEDHAINNSSIDNHHNDYDYSFSKVQSDSSFSTSCSSLASSSSFSSLLQQPSRDTSFASKQSPTRTQQQQQESQEQPSSRNVRFASVPMVRTYSLVLGDHPMCDDGLAIELGWDYNQQQQQYEEEEETTWSLTPLKTSCQRRSYLSRKQLLLDVAGCSKEELDQRFRERRMK